MDECSIGLIIVGAAGMICIIIVAAAKKHEGYREGQIDAINGKIVYKLVEFKDGTRGYYKESELKDLIEHKIIEPWKRT
jgi:hypothetical protein